MFNSQKVKTIIIICFILFITILWINIQYSITENKIENAKEGMFHILVTGGAGFIGSHLVEYFENEQKCDKIIVLDNLSTGFKSNLANFKKVILIQDSITNREKVKFIMNKYKPKYVFHFGAKISVEESMSKPIEYNEVNTIGTIILLEEARDAGVERFIFSSSAAIYGRDPKVPKHEDDKPMIASPYAQTKLDGEVYLRLFDENSKMKTVSLRYFNVFGERQDPHSQYAAVIPQFIDLACRQKKDLSIYGDGEQTRDFVYVKDVVLANVYAATKMDEKFTGTHYNVGYGKSITINQLANIIIKECNSNSKIGYREERKGDVRHSRANINKLLSTGWKPQYEFDEALAKTVRWFLNKQ